MTGHGDGGTDFVLHMLPVPPGDHLVHLQGLIGLFRRELSWLLELKTPEPAMLCPESHLHPSSFKGA
jgi:hypothetical protein